MSPHDSINTDSPLLTAFALGELSGSARDAVARAVAKSPALQEAVAQIRAVAQKTAEQLRSVPEESAPLAAAVLRQIELRLEAEAQQGGGFAGGAVLGSAAGSVSDSSDGGSANAGNVTGRGTAAVSGSSDGGAATAAKQTDYEIFAGGQAGEAPTATAGNGGKFSEAAAGTATALGRAARKKNGFVTFRREVFAMPLAALFVACVSLGGLWWAERNSGIGEAGTFAGEPFLQQPLAANLQNRNASAASGNFAVASEDAVAVVDANAMAVVTTGDFAVVSENTVAGDFADAVAVVAAGADRRGQAMAAQRDSSVLAARSKSAKTAAVPAAASGGVAAGLSAVAQAADGNDSGGRSLVPAGRSTAQAAEEALPAKGRTVAAAEEKQALAPVAGMERTVTFRQRPFAAGGRMAREIRVVSTATQSGSGVALLEGAARNGEAPAVSKDGEGSAALQLAAAVNAKGEPQQSDVAPAMPQASSLALAEGGGLRRLRAASAQSDVVPSPVAAEQRIEDATARLMAEVASLVQPLDVPAEVVPANSFGALAEETTATISAASDAGAGRTMAVNAALLAVVPVGAGAGNSASVVDAALAVDLLPAGDAAEEVPPAAPPVYRPVVAGRSLADASLDELEAAAFANVAVALRLEGHQAEERNAARVSDAELAARAVVPRIDLSSPYQQIQLWIGARQLPPKDSIDVELVVRDVASDRIRFPKETSRSERAALLTDEQLTVIETNSPLVRAVRAYAEVIRDQPTDADARLQAITEELATRRGRLSNRKIQELLKLITDTRNLL